ncbi:MAG: hypothetical protein RLZZ437_2407 [Pseudomonadota bacterium]
MHRFAVLADPHYHELFPGYPIDGVTFRGGAGACLRSREDSAASTRIYNESALALPWALDACAAQGIRTVIIPGDLTDDGQAPSMAGALALLADYRARHGMRFFLTPGNHDVYGMSGRHHTKTFLTADGGRVKVSSRADAATVHDPRMACRGYGGLIDLWRDHGLMRSASDLHWESPFGPDDAQESRMFTLASPDGTVRHRQIDTSYLVEPEEGLWLLSVDANVFEPRNGRPDNRQEDAFDDSTNAGWNALVRLKPFLLDWMADVARRAAAGGKTLICFSHYPVADVLRDTYSNEVALFGRTASALRNPTPETAARVAATGVTTHISGHLHYLVTAQVSHGAHRLTNIAAPSPVAFPPAFLTLSAKGKALDMTVHMIDMPDFDAFFHFYANQSPEGDASRDWLSATSYPQFLYFHIRELVQRRFMAREWPDDLRQFISGRTVDDLFALSIREDPVHLPAYNPPACPRGLPMIDLLTDWYAARSAGPLVWDFVPAERRQIWADLIAAFELQYWDDPQCLQSRLRRWLNMFACTMSSTGDASFVGSHKGLAAAPVNLLAPRTLPPH